MKKIKENEEGGLWIISDHQLAVKTLLNSPDTYDTLLGICKKFYIDFNTISFFDYGGQGLLFKCPSEYFNSTIIIKLPFYNEYEYNKSKEMAILKEARTLSVFPKSNHGYVPKLLYYDSSGKYLIKKYYNFSHMTDVINSYKDCPSVIAKVVIKQFLWLTNTLQKAFSETVIVSDYKVSNLLYNCHQHVPMLIDLGNSKVISQIRPDSLSTYKKIGSKHFLHWPPELLIGQSSVCGAKCNDFIFGVFLYYVFFHDYPYKNDQILTSKELYYRYLEQYVFACQKIQDAYEKKTIDYGMRNILIGCINPDMDNRDTLYERL